MSGGILRFPWTSQPQTPVGVSRGDSLARGLIRLWGTPSGYESATGSRATPQSGANASYFAGGIKYASAISIGAVSGVDAGSITELRGLGDFTVVTLAIPNGLIARQTLWEISGASDLGVATGYSTATSIFSYARGAGDFVAQTGSGMFVDGQRVCVGYTYKNSLTADFYKNGKLHASANTSSGGTVSSSITNFHIGGRGSSNLATWAGVIEFTAVWNRALSALEHAQIAANPWQLFAPIQRTIWVPAAGGGATYTLTAASGSFALTGQDAGLAFNRVLAADTQSYTLTGQATGLAFNRTLAAASGSFTLTGQDAGLAFNRVLSAASGSFALDGQDVTLTYTPISGATYTLGAASGSFALTGQDTGLAFNRVLTADTQSYSLSGDVAGLAFNRVLTADTVSYALTGQDVALTYTSNGFTYTLTAESGSFEVAGQDASFRHTQNAIAGGGGWLPQTRRKSRKQIYEERVKLGILPPPVIKAAAKVAAVAQTVEEFKEERPKYEEMFLKAIKKTEWLPDYTRAIQAQLAIMEQEEEELLLLL